MKSLTFSLGHLTVILELLFTKQLKNIFFGKKPKPDYIKLEYVFKSFFPTQYHFWDSTISDLQNSTKCFTEPQYVYGIFVLNLFTCLSLTFPVCSTGIFSICLPSMCPRLSDLLVAAIYKLCFNSSCTPHVLHFSEASLPFPPKQNRFYLKVYTPPVQVFSQGSLFSFCFLTCCLMLIFTCFSHLSSCNLLTLQWRTH